MMSSLLSRLQGIDIVASGVRTVSVDSDGTFTWQRKTGKEITVYFSSDTIRSNSVTIPPR